MGAHPTKEKLLETSKRTHTKMKVINILNLKNKLINEFQNFNFFYFLH